MTLHCLTDYSDTPGRGTTDPMRPLGNRSLARPGSRHAGSRTGRLLGLHARACDGRTLILESITPGSGPGVKRGGRNFERTNTQRSV